MTNAKFEPMSPDEFRALALIIGADRFSGKSNDRGMASLSRFFGKSRDTIRAWSSGEYPIPEESARKLRDLARKQRTIADYLRETDRTYRYTVPVK